MGGGGDMDQNGVDGGVTQSLNDAALLGEFPCIRNIAQCDSSPWAPPPLGPLLVQ